MMVCVYVLRAIQLSIDHWLIDEEEGEEVGEDDTVQVCCVHISV